MKIAIVGTISKDIIIPYKGVPVRSLGGIFYQLTTLLNFLKNGDCICPVSYYSEDLSYILSALGEKWNNVDFSGLIPIRERNYQQILEYSTFTKSEEKSFFFFPQLRQEHLENALDADFILINMFSGKDMGVKVFQDFAQDVYDKLYLNVRSLLFETDELGNKIPNRPDDIFEWLNYARFIQLNETEFNILNKEGMDFERYWSGLLRPSQNVLLTLGAKGVWWITNKDGLMIKKYPAYNVKNIIETTGCGDVFSAAFSYGFLKHGKIPKAIELGILAASSSTIICGTENICNLKTEMCKLNNKIVEAVV